MTAHDLALLVHIRYNELLPTETGHQMKIYQVWTISEPMFYVVAATKTEARSEARWTMNVAKLPKGTEIEEI